MHQASCLCGSIQIGIGQDLSDFGYCHCRSCQKASGSAFGANAGVERASVTIRDPNGYLKEFSSSPGKHRAFCSHCGAPLFAYHAASRDIIRIRLGSLDSVFEKTCKAHTFVAEKASWEKICADVPAFDGWADPNILVQLGSTQPENV